MAIVEIDMRDDLKSFLYLLLRDKLPAGEVEALVMEVEKCTDKSKVLYSNKYIADYAKELAFRIRHT
jgi:hypothetical protein